MAARPEGPTSQTTALRSGREGLPARRTGKTVRPLNAQEFLQPIAIFPEVLQIRVELGSENVALAAALAFTDVFQVRVGQFALSG